MHYGVKSTMRSGTSHLPRRLLLAFVAICFFCAITGVVGLLHHHDRHGPADSDCQICYLLTVAAVGQIAALIVLFMLAGTPRRMPCLLAVSADSADPLLTAAPRAPPLR